MIFIAFYIALGIALAVTPVSIRVAHRIGAMDIPKDERRMHKKPIPRFGGMAIFLGTMVPFVFFLHDDRQMRIVMLGGVLIYAIGVWDDLKDLPARLKLVLEFGVAILLFAMGLQIRFLNSLDWELSSVLCLVITVLWIVGITNTVNMVDGLDGLAAGVTAIASLAIAYVAYIHGNKLGLYPVSLAMMTVAGSALGFLPFNRYPAKTFMGDSGALFLGYMLAALSVVGPLRKSTLVAVIVPVMVMGLPIFDTFMAILRRYSSGQSIMGADKGHFHHRLMASGYGQRRAVLMIYGISAIMGMAAILISRELYKDAAVLVIIAALYIYIFLTDSGHKMPSLKAVNIAEEEKKERRKSQRETPSEAAKKRREEEAGHPDISPKG